MQNGRKNSAMEEGEYKMRGKKVVVVTLCALLLFEALAFASVSLGQQKALADEATFYSTASDGYLEDGNSSYTIAHGAGTGVISDDGTYLGIGQMLELTPLYYVDRGALFFDTSSLPDNVYITSATLSLYGEYDFSTTDFNITVVDGSSLNDPLVAGDYSYLRNQTTSGGAFNTAGFSTSGYNDIPLNAAGMGWISKTGMTKFGLRSSRDITPTEPSGYEVVDVSSYEAGVEYRPMLVVSYEYVQPPPSAVPTLSQWGMIGMAIVLAAALVWSVRRRWVVSASKS
jgi:hypothetical protein